MTLLLLFILLILMICNAYLLAVEFTMVSFTHQRLDANSDSTNKVKAWLEDVEIRRRFLAASQLGAAMGFIGIGAAGWVLVYLIVFPWLAEFGVSAIGFTLLKVLIVVISLSILVILQRLLVEGFSRRMAAVFFEEYSRKGLPVLRFFVWITWPLAKITNWAGKGLSLYQMGPQASLPADLQQVVSNPQKEEILNAPEQEMLTAVMDFSNLVVRQVSVPRTEVVAIEASKPAAELIRMFMEKGLTKIPVYENDLDHIIGIVHLRDLVVELENGSLDSKLAQDVAREGLFVPETIAVTDLLRQFRDNRVHIAIVLDEYGGTAGLVTLEDLLEEIIGDVQDEFEEAGSEIEILEDGTAKIDGMTFIEDVNEFLGLSLSEPDYDTIAGYILGKLGRIPQEGDVVVDREQQVQLLVDQMDRHRISQILLKRL
jgi:CBS domain containing-hemolysin-like protein